MKRIIIEDSDRDEILSKYNDNTSDRFLTYLRRNFPVHFLTVPRYNPKIDDYEDVKVPGIMVDEKIRFVEDNKVSLVNKISWLLEDEFTDIPLDVKRRTIKKYIDMIQSSKPDGN